MASETPDDAPPPASAPAKTSTPTQEWGAAVALMILFAFMCAAFISFLRG